MFWRFETRLDLPLLSLDQLNPLIRDHFVKYSVRQSLAAHDFNDLIALYESLLAAVPAPPEKVDTEERIAALEMEIADWKKRNKGSSQAAQLAEEKFENANKLVKEHEAKIEEFILERSVSDAAISSLKRDLDSAQAKYDELSLNYDILIRSHDRALKESFASAQKGIRTRGKDVIAQIKNYSHTMRRRLMAQADVNELQSNKDMLDGLMKGTLSMENELGSVSSSLVAAELELAAIPNTSINFEELELVLVSKY